MTHTSTGTVASSLSTLDDVYPKVISLNPSLFLPCPPHSRSARPESRSSRSRTRHIRPRSRPTRFQFPLLDYLDPRPQRPSDARGCPARRLAHRRLHLSQNYVLVPVLDPSPSPRSLPSSNPAPGPRSRPRHQRPPVTTSPGP